jgi:hypothetical protein
VLLRDTAGSVVTEWCPDIISIQQEWSHRSKASHSTSCDIVEHVLVTLSPGRSMVEIAAGTGVNKN